MRRHNRSRGPEYFALQWRILQSPTRAAFKVQTGATRRNFCHNLQNGLIYALCYAQEARLNAAQLHAFEVARGRSSRLDIQERQTYLDPPPWKLFLRFISRMDEETRLGAARTSYA